MTERPFPDDAYAPTGELWWDLKFHPSDKGGYTKRIFGVEGKLAAWLYFNKEIGDRFTMREVRAVLGDNDIPNDHENFSRRMRRLRQRGWRILSSQEDAQLRTDEYRVTEKGWHPGQGPRPKAPGMVSGVLRRRVLERDGQRCVICGVANGEPYPDPPPGNAVMSIGHRIAQEHGGTDDIDNLQVECKRCNEPVREEVGLPETLDEVYAEVKGLKKAEKTVLMQWLRSGRRLRSKLDVLYDRARRLSPGERDNLIETLERATGSPRSGHED